MSGAACAITRLNGRLEMETAMTVTDITAGAFGSDKTPGTNAPVRTASPPPWETTAVERSSAPTDDGDDIAVRIIRPELADRLDDLNSHQLDAEVENCRLVISTVESVYGQARSRSLRASVAGYVLFSLLRDAHDEALKARVSRIKVKAGANPFHAYFQDFSGLLLNDMDEDRRGQFARVVSDHAKLWAVLDERYGGSAGSLEVDKIVAEVAEQGGMEAFARAKSRPLKNAKASSSRNKRTIDSSATPLNEFPHASGPPQQSLDEVLFSVPPDRERAFSDGDGTALGISVALERRVGGVVKTWRTDPPPSLLRQLLLFTGNTALSTCSDQINALGDILRVSELIADSTSTVPILADEDPEARSTPRHTSHAAIVWTLGGDFAVASDRRHSSIVLDAKPKVNLGLPSKLLWLTEESRTVALREFAPPRKQVAFDQGMKIVDRAGSGTDLHLGRREADDLIMRFVPAFDTKRKSDQWSWIVDREKYGPDVGLVMDAPAVIALSDSVNRVLRGKAKEKPIKVSFDSTSLRIDNGYANPLELPTRLEDENVASRVTVKVLGDDLAAVLSGALSVAKVDQLIWRVDVEGLLEIAFQTPRATYGAYIPLLDDDDGRFARTSRLLKRVTR